MLPLHFQLLVQLLLQNQKQQAEPGEQLQTGRATGPTLKGLRKHGLRKPPAFKV
jgi:hypothetical protein